MTTEALENLIEDPDVFAIGIDSAPIREVLVEIATRVDALQYKIGKTQKDDDPYEKDEIREINVRLNDMKKKQEQQNIELNAEIDELKQFFQYQLKDIRESTEKNNRQMNERILSMSMMSGNTSQPSTKPRTPIKSQENL